MSIRSQTLKYSLIFFSLFFFIFLFFHFVPTSAQDVSQMQAEIITRNQKIAQLQAEIDSYLKKVTTTHAEADTLNAAIAKLVAQKRDLENQIALTNLKIKQASDNVNQASKQIDTSKNNIQEIEQAINETLVTMKENDDTSSFILSVFASPSESFSVFLDRAYKLIDVNRLLKYKVDTLSKNIQDLNLAKGNYQSEQDKFSSLSEDLSSRKDLVLDNKEKQDGLLTKTKQEEVKYQEMIVENKKKVEALESEIQDFESKIKYTLNPDQLPQGGKGLLWPVDHPIIITQYFGDTPFASTGAYSGHGHSGIDIGVSVGTPILSAASGVVMGTGNTDVACKGASYGKWVLIKHSNGLATLYGHLSKIYVSEGESITAGQKIALSGATGYVTGPHLHFTVFAADAVKIFGPHGYKSKVCGTYMVMPYAALNAYLNPLNYLDNSQIDERPY